MENGLSASDVALMSRGNDGYGFGNEGLWLFAILALFGFGGNGFFSGGNDRAAAVGDVQRATDFQALERQNNEGVAATREAMYNVTSAVKDGNYNILGELRDIQQGTNAGFANMQNCCCETLRAIDGVNYNAAMNTAAINATTTAQTQKIIDALAQNKIETLQNQVNQLSLQSALCGVVRYPNSVTYTAGVSPFFAPAACGCNNI